MKNLRKTILVAFALLVSRPVMAASEILTPKTEFRSTWVSTVWNIDWPSIQGTSATQIKVQKNEMTKMLDSLAINNFNAVCFQARPMADAMYNSAYEPWSQFLTGTRGLDPGWDPLAFTVEESHARGIEVHTWINPFRFNTTGASGEGDPTGYYEKGWLMTTPKGYRYLNPSIAEVRAHIVNICKDIITKYDVDGIIFDDYYYDGAEMDQDATQYAEYTAAGGTMSQADWRRDNIHKLMTDIYNMILEVKPWVRFGQAPPGGTFQNASLAAAYGIDPCPSGYENCYNSQYINIIQWLKDGVVDYVSPQVYWAIGKTNADYGLMTPWWGEVTNKFGRHLFVSQEISNVSSMEDAGSSIVGVKSVSREIKPKMTSDGFCSTYGEVEAQVLLNRTSSKSGAFGSNFFSAKSLHAKTNTRNVTIAHDLKRYLYSCPALIPAMTWKSTVNPGTVSGLSYDDAGTLSWTAMSETKFARYSVYAVPNGLDKANFGKEVKYLLGVTYDANYTIPEAYQKGYYFAVCVYDRFGNEWSPAFLQKSYTTTLAAPTIVSPANGATLIGGGDLTWNAVSGAEAYAVDFAGSANFSEVQKSVMTTDTKLPLSAVLDDINPNVATYWQVRAVAKGKNDGKSEVRNFVYQQPELLTPTNGATDVEPQVNFTWVAPSETEPVTLEVASDQNFTDIVFTAESATGSYKTPICTLKKSTTYYARLIFNGASSKIVQFTTKYVAGEVPTWKFPTNGGMCYSNNMIEVNPQEGAYQVVIQIDSSTSFSGTTRCQKKLTDFVFGVLASEVKLKKNTKPLEDGVTYYARAYVDYYDESGMLKSTDYSDVISFVYNAGVSAITDVTAESDVKLAGNKVVVTSSTESLIKVAAVSMLGHVNVLYAGVDSNVEVSTESLAKGMYVLQVEVNGKTHTIKFVK